MPRDTDPITTSVQVHPPRSRRGQPTLSRGQIVSAAVELLDAKGLPGLSMRRLGTKLGAGATSVYWYVANKDELLELAVDEIMGEVDIPDPHEVGWRAAARGLAQGVRSVILHHPWMTGLFGVRPAIGPQAMRVSGRAMEVLTVAGFSGLELAHARALLMSHAIGSATTDVGTHTATARTGKSANEFVPGIGPYVQSIPAEHPHHVRWWSQNHGTDVDKLEEQSFTFGLERLLDGLETWLERRDEPGTAQSRPVPP